MLQQMFALVSLIEAETQTSRIGGRAKGAWGCWSLCVRSEHTNLLKLSHIRFIGSNHCHVLICSLRTTYVTILLQGQNALVHHVQAFPLG